MNTAVRAAVRVGLANGHTMLGIRNGFEGLLSDDVMQMDWMSVNGWARRGGAILGIRRADARKLDYKAVAAAFAKHRIQSVIMIGIFQR